MLLLGTYLAWRVKGFTENPCHRFSSSCFMQSHLMSFWHGVCVHRVWEPWWGAPCVLRGLCGPVLESRPGWWRPWDPSRDDRNNGKITQVGHITFIGPSLPCDLSVCPVYSHPKGASFYFSASFILSSIQSIRQTQNHTPTFHSLFAFLVLTLIKLSRYSYYWTHTSFGDWLLNCMHWQAWIPFSSFVTFLWMPLSLELQFKH